VVGTPVVPAPPWEAEVGGSPSPGFLFIYAFMHLLFGPPLPSYPTLFPPPPARILSIYLFIYLWGHWGLNSGPYACYAGAFIAWVTPPDLFCDGQLPLPYRVPWTICPGMASNQILHICLLVTRITGMNHWCFTSPECWNQSRQDR
jgi:hypothetical protein